jgi:hypothetical protein
MRISCASTSSEVQASRCRRHLRTRLNCATGASCQGCADHAGPGTDGCYWDPSLSGTCDWYWSDSGVDEGPYDAWFLYFQQASVQYGAQAIEKYVRCVRSEP